MAEESRRGSVRWDTMERLNDPASEVHKDEIGEKIELGFDPTTNSLPGFQWNTTIQDISMESQN